MYLAQHSDRIFGYVVRIPWYLIADGPEQLVLVAAAERRLADQHFVQQHAERPPVDGLIVVLTLTFGLNGHA